MENQTFVTETDVEFAKQQFKRGDASVFIVGTLLSCLGLLISWPLFLLFEAVIVFSCVMSVKQQQARGFAWRLEFFDNELIITNLTTGEQFRVYDTPASDFIVKRSRYKNESDCCTFAVKRTIFCFDGVKNCEQLRVYIQENFD
jgi:hypothetical protein